MIDFHEDKHAVSQLHQFRSRKSKRTRENASSILTTLHISGRPEQSKAHLFNNPVVRWRDYLGKEKVLTNTDFNKFLLSSVCIKKSFNSTCEKSIFYRV